MEIKKKIESILEDVIEEDVFIYYIGKREEDIVMNFRISDRIDGQVWVDVYAKVIDTSFESEYLECDKWKRGIDSGLMEIIDEILEVYQVSEYNIMVGHKDGGVPSKDEILDVLRKHFEGIEFG